MRLDAAAPREARIAGGMRRFVEAIRYHFLVPVIVIGILGTLAGLGYGGRKVSRGTRVSTGPHEGTSLESGRI